jgi:hypothetical protein
VVAINNDSIGLASTISFTPASNFIGKVLLAGNGQDHEGICDLKVKDLTLGTTTITNNVFFGGNSSITRRMEVGDRVMVGYDAADNVALGTTGNMLFLFSSDATSCTSGCGTFQQGAWTVGSLSQAIVSSASTNGRIVVGAYPTTFGSLVAISTSFYYSTVGAAWGSAADHADSDCDGLSVDLERDLGSCDDATGPSPDCASTSRRKWRQFPTPTTFNASDTDSDGLRDDTEIYGIMVVCDRIPATPFYNPGKCTNSTYTRTSGRTPFCPLGNLNGPIVRSVTNALSMIGTSPTEPDFLLHALGVVGGGLSTSSLNAANYAYGVEGLECVNNTDTLQTSCPSELTNYNRINLHVSQSFESKYPTQDFRLVPPAFGVWPGYSDYNVNFPAERRDTGTFHFEYVSNFFSGKALGIPGRIAIVPDRNSVIRNNSPYDAGSGDVFIHETGHLAGAVHSTGVTSQSANAPSVMNYWHVQSPFPKKQAPGIASIWPSDFGNACSGSCTFGVCISGKCAVNCPAYERHFSRGLMPALSEPSATESPLPATLAALNQCYGQDSPFNGNARMSSCAGGSCWVDWNLSGTTASGAADLDLDGATTTASVADQDDWLRFRQLLSLGIRPDAPYSDLAHGQDAFARDLLVFNSELESTTPVDLTPFNATLTLINSPTSVPGIPSNSGVTPPFVGSGNALHFAGPSVTAQRVKIASNAAIETLAQVDSTSSVAPRGFRFDIVVKIDDFTHGTGHLIAVSNLFDLSVLNSTRRVTFGLTAGPAALAITNPQQLVVGTWYRITALWNENSGKMRLYVIPWNSSSPKWNYLPGGTCMQASLNLVSYVNTMDIYLGALPSAPTAWALTGTLDQVRLWNYIPTDHPAGSGTGCAYQFDIDQVQCFFPSTTTPDSDQCGQF